MHPFLIVSAVVIFCVGIFVGRKYEQKAVAEVLTTFAAVDHEAKDLVSRCYLNFSAGIKRELDKLQKMV